jgi:hypothetical protein
LICIPVYADDMPADALLNGAPLEFALRIQSVI